MNEVQSKKLRHLRHPVSGSGLRRLPVPGGGNNLKLKRPAVMFSDYGMIYDRSSYSIAILLKYHKSC